MSWTEERKFTNQVMFGHSVSMFCVIIRVIMLFMACVKTLTGVKVLGVMPSELHKSSSCVFRTDDWLIRLA